MRVIHLTHGAGNGEDQACLMTASNMLIGKPENLDCNSCVCPLLRVFIISTNDAMPIPLLNELYGPLAWEILGTELEGVDAEEYERIMVQRLLTMVDWLVRDFTPGMVRLFPSTARAVSIVQGLESLPEIKNFGYASRAENLVRSSFSRGNPSNIRKGIRRYSYDSAWYDTYIDILIAKVINVFNGLAKLDQVLASGPHSRAMLTCIGVSVSVGEAAAYLSTDMPISLRDREALWRKCPEIIRRVAAIGDKRPVETVMTHDELADKLCRVKT